MKNFEIFLLYETLVDLSTNIELKIPIKIGYIFLKNKNLLEPYYQAINDSREKIIKEYGTRKDDGSYSFSNENFVIANNKLNEILDIEENISLEKINIDDISVNLPMNVINGLMPILKDKTSNINLFNEDDED